MKTTERLEGPAMVQRITSEEPVRELIYSADPLGVWVEKDVFLPWSSIEWVKTL